MNNKVNLKDMKTKIFILNLVVLIFSIIIIFLLKKIGFITTTINILIISNIIIYLFLLIFSIFYLKKENNIYRFIIKLILIIYIVCDIFIIFIMNNYLSRGYDSIHNKLNKYSNNYNCITYETIKLKNKRDYTFKKIYLDFNGKENNIVVHNVYDNKNILYIKINITSKKELFSADLIKYELQPYLNNFKVYISTKDIQKAFENKDNKPIYNKNIKYFVKQKQTSNEDIEFETDIIIDFMKK